MILRGALKSIRKTADRELWSVDDSRSFFTWISAVSVQVVWWQIGRCPRLRKQLRHGPPYDLVLIRILPQLSTVIFFRPLQWILGSFKKIMQYLLHWTRARSSQKTTTPSNSKCYGDDILKNRWSAYLTCLQGMCSPFKTSSLFLFLFLCF